MIGIVAKEHMPKATSGDPYAQVAWLFHRRAALAIAAATKANYRGGLGHMIAFLREDRGEAADKPYEVNEQFDEYTLLRFKTYIEDQQLSSYSVATILSAVRQVMQCAVENQWISLSRYIDISVPQGVRETSARLAYSEDELRCIEEALDSDIRFSRGLLKPYVRTGVGRAPKQTRPTLERGWARDKNNLRWYFENLLDCRPITSKHSDAPRHKKFLVYASQAGGLHKLYRRWGVSAWIGPDVILPYVFKLVAATGINPSVAYALHVDSFQEEHPLTGRPYIRYWKERGHGAEELHPHLISDGVLELSERQASEIAKIWREVKQLTASFRAELPPDRRSTLFLYQSRSVKFPGAPRDFMQDDKTAVEWAAEFVERHQLKSRTGSVLSLSLARFRPSLVSRLLKRGVDLFLIKEVLGHRSILQTLRYIQGHDFMPHARREVERSLEQIRENRTAHRTSPKPVASGKDGQEEEVVFATPVSLCKDVFSPPANIRRAAGIEIGRPCTVFNMCLRCPNVILMDEHLPMLFAIRRQYIAALDGGLASAPHRSFIMQSIFLLDNILDPERSEWSDETLSDARAKSELLDPIVDSVAHRGVEV